MIFFAPHSTLIKKSHPFSAFSVTKRFFFLSFVDSFRTPVKNITWTNISLQHRNNSYQEKSQSRRYRIFSKKTSTSFHCTKVRHCPCAPVTRPGCIHMKKQGTGRGLKAHSFPCRTLMPFLRTLRMYNKRRKHSCDHTCDEEPALKNP